MTIGLVLPASGRLRSEQTALIDALVAAKGVTVSHVFVASPESSRLGLFTRALMRLYRLCDRKFLSGSQDPHDTTVDAYRDRLKPCTWVVGLDPKPVETAADATALDAIVCIGLAGDASNLATRTRFGVLWIGPHEISHEDTAELRRTLDTLRANAARDTVWWLGPGSKHPIAIATASARPVSPLSVVRNAASLSPLHADLVLQALRKIVKSPPRIRRHEAPPDGQVPGAVDLASSLLGAMARHVRHRLSGGYFPDYWVIGVRKRRTDALSHLDGSGYHWAKSPNGHWWADPFLFEHETGSWLFFEEIEQADATAVLACAPLDEQGRVGPSSVILTRPYHVSYPQVFAVGGEVFLLPETGMNGTVELYRARTFPYQWELVRVLQKAPLFDTTVHERDGRFWFFTSLLASGTSPAAQLLLFSASAIDGDWKLHPASPISADARFARNAGRIIKVGDGYLRPTQDCSRTYGGAVCFQAIKTWNDIEYEEEDGACLTADAVPQALGVHTYNRTTSFEVIDRKITRDAFAWLSSSR